MSHGDNLTRLRIIAAVPGYNREFFGGSIVHVNHGLGLCFTDIRLHFSDKWQRGQW